MERHNFNLRNGQFDRLRKLARLTDITPSEHIRVAVERYLSEEEQAIATRRVRRELRGRGKHRGS